MNVKNTCTVTVPINREERKIFAAIAIDLDVSCSILMRRLVKFFLNGKISWNKLFKQQTTGVDEARVIGKSYMRTKLEPERYAAFVKMAEEWGSTPSVVLRRLVLRYIAEDIERRDVW
jgi:hypothetical protein